MFNRFTKLSEQVEITIVEDGIEKQVSGFLYRCDGSTSMGTCRLVWNRAWLAKQCADHGHRQSWQDGNWTREAVRRDGKTVSTPPAPAPVAPVIEDPVAQLRALALSLGFRLTKIPVKQTPEFEIIDQGSEDLPF